MHEVTLTKEVGWRSSQLTGKGIGPYDGDYAVTREGGVGYITVRLRNHAQFSGLSSCPKRPDLERMADCTSEKVPGVGTLSIWRVPTNKGVPPSANSSRESAIRSPSYSRLETRVVREDGTTLRIVVYAGIRVAGKQKPPLKTFPLTRNQLRQLALNPALLP
ncbi:hypothetical protein [Streptomyces sp. AK04-3B]|uniref:hypothetical protein n=1 Tax=Streptomyces sp. AK04-3B TaxID=3028650 RepID=UPI0029BD9686|nr:hypothetical protein [Streptomyces sp. AK04-3B]MDX3804182.1 hypothetical protein [Streptomyces sp. AK04-3B]